MRPRTEHDPTGEPSQVGELEELFLRYRDTGDVGAIGALYDRTAVRLLSAASHLCTETADAEDAVQATFLTALESAHEWDSERPLLPWLNGILLNRVRRQRRSAGRRIEVERVLTAAATADELEAVEFSQAVDEAIAGMPRLYQAALVLRLKHGMAPSDIAHALRRPPATVRAQLSRGMDLLRKALPASFASALALFALPTRGLAAVRDSVVWRAGELSAALEGTAPVAAHGAGTSLGVRTIGILTGAALALLAVLAGIEFSGASSRAPDPARPKVETSGAVEAGDASPAPIVGGPARSVVRGNEPEVGGLLVRLLADGVPAAFAPVTVEPLGANATVWRTHLEDRFGTRQILEPTVPGGDPVVGITNGDGEHHFPGLRAGWWLVRGPGSAAPVRVDAKATTRIVGEIGREAVRVAGTVLGDDGDPVAGASIAVSPGHHVRAVRQIMVSDAAGRFAVYVDRGSFVTAAVAGSRSSGLRIDPKTGECDVRIQLRSGGATVIGRVVDPTGEPVPGAWLQLGTASALQFEATTNGELVRGVPVRVRADARGRFAVHGLEAGDLRVLVRGPETGWSRYLIRAEAGDEDVIELVAGADGVLQGVVTDAFGIPLSRVRVRAVMRGLSHFEHPATETDDTGHYVLRGLGSGVVNVTAGSVNLGWARLDGGFAVGEQRTWNPVLSADAARIRGRLTDANGRALEGHVIVRDDGQHRVVTKTDGDGRFAFDLPEFNLGGVSALLAYPPGVVDRDRRARAFAVARAVGVRAGGNLELVARASDLPLATLTGSVRAAEGRPRRRLALVGEDPQDRVLLDVSVDDSGAPIPFVIRGVPPGRYWLSTGGAMLGPIVVTGAGAVDVGLQTFHGPVRTTHARRGEVLRTLSFEAPDGPLTSCSLRVEVEDATGFRTTFNARREGAHWRLPLSLPPGRYRVFAVGDGLTADAEIDVGEEARAAVLVPATRAPGARLSLNR